MAAIERNEAMRQGLIQHGSRAGFDLPDSRISLPYLWWSRPDIGFLEWIGVPVPKKREETLINAVAIKPSAV